MTTRRIPTIDVIRARPPEMGQCRTPSCRRAIEWVTTLKGKRMPVDAPLAAERIHERTDGTLVYTIAASASHFATCPAAKHWSAKNRPQRTH